MLVLIKGKRLGHRCAHITINSCPCVKYLTIKNKVFNKINSLGSELCLVLILVYAMAIKASSFYLTDL